MRLAIVTDIHEDFEMLEQAFEQIASIGYDLLVCLGDITGFAPRYYNHTPNANACIDLIRQKANIVLLGNHDLFSSQRLPSYHLEKNIPANWYDLSLAQRYKISQNTLWLYEEEVFPSLTPQNIDFLRGLKEWATIDLGESKILFSHFLQPDLAGVARWFPYRVGELRPHFRFMDETNALIAFTGHGHPEGFTILNKLFWTAPCTSSARVRQRQRIVMCPALVRSQRMNGFITFDTQSNVITPYFHSK